jgi:hypothetical protein
MSYATCILKAMTGRLAGSLLGKFSAIKPKHKILFRWNVSCYNTFDRVATVRIYCCKDHMQVINGITYRGSLGVLIIVKSVALPEEGRWKSIQGRLNALVIAPGELRCYK